MDKHNNITLFWDIKKAILEAETEKSVLLRENRANPSVELQKKIEALNQRIQSLEANLKILLEEK